MRGFLLLIFFLFFILPHAASQKSVESIKKLRESTAREIEYANKLLEETKGRTKQSLQEVNIINEKLKKRKEIIVSLETEAAILADGIAEGEAQVSALEKKVNRLKSAYASMLVRNYKSRAGNYFFIYFLAAENMNQFYQRFRFVKIYMNYIRIQKRKLEILSGEIGSKTNDLLKIKSEKEKLVNETQKEYTVFKREQEKKKTVLNSLTKKQGDIEREIREKKRTAERLDREITRLIESERSKSGTGVERRVMTPTEQIISNDFGRNEGKLPWPTQKGVISGKYGEHEHPDFKSVKIRNDGIYISTGKGEPVRAVFKGVVSRVFALPGENYTIIIKHGNYYTLYHNIVDVKVRAGQQVDTKEIIGKVYTDTETKETTLYFQVWKETERNDPELWLAH